MANTGDTTTGFITNIRLQRADAARCRALQITEEMSKVLETIPAGCDLRKRLVQDIHSLRSKGRPAETVLAFCGETGAGKSSLINALLGENIVRTSGMAACTAVVTEIRYNTRNTIEAEIEYLTLSEWKDEVEHLLLDLKDTADGQVKNRHDMADEEAVAWEKIYAVYPSVSEGMLTTTSADQLLRCNTTMSLMLGHTARISVDNSEPQKFTNELSRYLDPQDDPSTGSSWPLIRKVQIRYRSQVLSSGAVLVDLPGTADSNAARCKITEHYLMRANRFFVVSPMTRAVSSKVARDLCGEAFRTQLKLDGKYSPDAITFVVTKCDDIVPHEVVKEPGLKAVLGKCTELTDLDREIEMCKARLNEGCWQAPAGANGRRPANDLQISLPSKRQLEVSDSFLNRAEKRPRASTSLSSAIISTRAQETSDEFNGEVWDFRHIMERLEHFKVRRNGLLATYRSKWSKRILQADFKLGLDDFDEDTLKGSTRIDDDHNLPVFTCSARDYMRIIGKTLDGDTRPLCFSNAEETEIPALCRWIFDMTIPAREQASHALFVQLSSLLAALSEFIKGTPGVTAADREKLQLRWKSRILSLDLFSRQGLTVRAVRAASYRLQPLSIASRLTKSFEAVSDKICLELQKAATSRLEQRCRDSATLAASAVLGISDKFAAEMHWNTYRATLRRLGIFKRDLNAELTLPFTRRIAASWSRTFGPRHMSSLEDKLVDAILDPLLSELAASVPEYLRSRAKDLQDSAKTVALSMLPDVREAIQEMWHECLKLVTRLMVPFVQSNLTDIYQRVQLIERKPGMFKLQRKLFHDLLESKKDVMFVGAAAALKQHLAETIQSVRDALDEHLEKIAKNVEIHMAVLWECPLESDYNIKARCDARATLINCKAEVERWLQVHNSG